MSDENNTPQGGGEALPASTTAAPAATEPAAKPVPKSDGEAALQAAAEVQPEADAAAEAAKKEAEAKAEQDKAEKRKNRTREYINRINGENADMRRRLAEYEARPTQAPSAVQRHQSSSQADGEPTLEDYNFNVVEFQRAHSAWAVQNALKTEREKSQQAESTQQQQKVVDAYNERIADFADEHPDFPEVVGSIAYPLSAEIQLAIMAHEKGAEIAYHLGNNDDDAFSLASIQPHLAAAAVERLASRLTAAQSQAPTQPTQPIQPKPISSAPPPAPSVSGRSPTETPPEKLTDDEWYKRDAERRRKR